MGCPVVHPSSCFSFSRERNLILHATLPIQTVPPAMRRKSSAYANMASECYLDSIQYIYIVIFIYIYSGQLANHG